MVLKKAPSGDLIYDGGEVHSSSLMYMSRVLVKKDS